MNNWERAPRRAYVELSDLEAKIWRRAAKRSRMTMSDWIRQAVNLHIGPWEEYRYESKEE